MTKESITWAQPSHPDLIKVEIGEKSFSARAVAMQSLKPNEVLAKISGTTKPSQRRYTSVQASKTEDIELNSDLVYTNHSCDPNLIFDMKRMEVRVGSERPLNKGDELTFFYPSTEWDMVQPFACTCGVKGKCIGQIRGAKYLDTETLKKYWLNEHIIELLAERDAAANGA